MAKRNGKRKYTVQAGIKKGALSKDEKDYVEKFFSAMSDEEMGTELNRSPNQIEKYRREIEYKKNNVDMDAQLKDKYLSDFRKHPHYEKLKTQFTREEFIGFEMKYIGMVAQFQSATFTEQEQIFDYLTASIYVDRLAVEQLETMKDVNFHSQMIEEIKANGKDYLMTNQTTVFDLTNTIASLRSISSAKNKEYNDLSKIKVEAMKQLKGTREQRMKKGEDAKNNVVGLMRMLDAEDTRRELGIESMLNQAAMEKEKKRLGKNHTYDNGEIDRPLLSSDTVKYGED